MYKLKDQRPTDPRNSLADFAAASPQLNPSDTFLVCLLGALKSRLLC